MKNSQFWLLVHYHCILKQLIPTHQSCISHNDEDDDVEYGADTHWGGSDVLGFWPRAVCSGSSLDCYSNHTSDDLEDEDEDDDDDDKNNEEQMKDRQRGVTHTWHTGRLSWAPSAKPRSTVTTSLWACKNIFLH